MKRAAAEIVREGIVYAAVSAAPATPGKRRRRGAAGVLVYHACWPSEFPLAICGAIATEAVARPMRNHIPIGVIHCEDCCRLMVPDIPLVRDNPHRAG